MSVRAMDYALHTSTARGLAKLALVALAWHADEDGLNAFPSHATWAAGAGMSERSLQRLIPQLEADGHIVRDGARPRGGTIVWKLAGLPVSPTVGETASLPVSPTVGETARQDETDRSRQQLAGRSRQQLADDRSLKEQQLIKSPRSAGRARGAGERATPNGHGNGNGNSNGDWCLVAVESHAEVLCGVLQRGIDGLTGDERYKRPTVDAVGEVLARHAISDQRITTAAAIAARSIAQAQNRAPNIVALFEAQVRKYRDDLNVV